MASELLMTGGVLVLLIKVTLVLALSLVWAIVLGRASASTRHLLWLTCLSLLLVVPLVSIVAPSLRVVPLPFDPSALSPGAGASSVTEAPPAFGVRWGEGGQTVAGSRPAPLATPVAARVSALGAGDLLWVLLAVWGAGSLLLLGHLALSAVALRRALRKTVPLEGSGWTIPLCEAADRLDLADIPRLVRSEDAPMPFACGFRRPTIVLPAVAEQWDASRRQAVLFHELAHIRRRDLVGHTVARLVCALYWIHPMVWTAARRLRAESERACDDLALSVGIRASDYADHLLQIVTAVRGSRSPAVALPFADRRELEGRVLAILDPVLHRGRPSGANVGALALLLVCGVAFAAVAPAKSPAAPGPGHEGFTLHVSSETPPPADAAAPQSEDGPEQALHEGATSLEHAAGETEPEETESEEWAEEKPALIIAREDGPQAADLPLLLNALATDPSPIVRKTAAWSIARFDTPATVAALARALQGDRDPEVRETAAWALEGDRSASTAQALHVALTRDESDDVRATAAWALGSMSRPPASVLPALEHALSDQSEEVRQRAAWAMGSIEPDAAPVPLYRNALSDPAANVRQAAAWALGQIRDPRAGEALLARLDVEKDEDVAKAVARAVLLTTPRTPAALERLVRSPNAEVRAWGIAAAGGGTLPMMHWPWPWPWPRPNP